MRGFQASPRISCITRQNQLINKIASAVCLRCPLRFRLPRAPDIRFQLLLSIANPGRIVVFRDSYAAMSEELGDLLQRYSCQQQFDRKRVAELWID